jgi:hypothetical protein
VGISTVPKFGTPNGCYVTIYWFNQVRGRAGIAYLLFVRSLRRWPARVFSCSWMLWALTMAMINPGKRLSISAQRDVLCISTPRRSPRINPASRRALKCWERVDLGMTFSLTCRKFEQFCEQSEPAMSAKMATRTGSESACRIASTVTSSIEG